MAVVEAPLTAPIALADRIPFLRAKRQELKDFVTSVTTPRLPGIRIDYTNPLGDPGPQGPDSMSWKVMRHLPVLVAGGGTAVLLEMIDKHVGAGVSQFSTYREDPIARLRGTLSPAFAMAYAPTGFADEIARRINARHKGIEGKAFDGTDYKAQDPMLYSWVHATAVFGFMQAYARFVDPKVSMADRDRYIEEVSSFAEVIGCSVVPKRWSDILDFFEDYRKSGQLSHNEYVEEFKYAAMHSKQAMFGSGSAILQVSYAMLPEWSYEFVKPKFNRTQLAYGDFIVRTGMKTLATLVPDDVPATACARVGVPVSAIS